MLGPLTLKANEKIGMIGNLATMLSAGVPILEAVASIMEDTNGNQRKVLEALRTDLTQGKQISASFSKFPGVFDVVTINLIKASEEAGTLEMTLSDLRIHMEREQEFSDKIKLALVYPALICVVFFMVVMVILIVVVPKISQVFSRLKVQLPLPTRILIFMSELITSHPIRTVIVVAILGVFGWWLIRTQKKHILAVLFKLPVVNTLVKNIDLARFSRTMYLLLNSAVPIDQALGFSKQVVLRQDMANMIEKTKEMVSSGKQFADGLRANKGSLPSIVIKLVEAGEKTGSLDKAMQDISKHLDYQVSNSLKSLTAIIEPLLLVLVGISVGGMMLAIIAPIYGLIGSVNSR